MVLESVYMPSNEFFNMRSREGRLECMDKSKNTEKNTKQKSILSWYISGHMCAQAGRPGNWIFNRRNWSLLDKQSKMQNLKCDEGKHIWRTKEEQSFALC